jgi:hypothetical protein
MAEAPVRQPAESLLDVGQLPARLDRAVKQCLHLRLVCPLSAVEKMAGRTPDRGALKWPIGGGHDEPATDLGGKPASGNSCVIQVRRAVKEDDLNTVHEFPFVVTLPPQPGVMKGA